MKIAYWEVQVDIKKAIEDRGHEALGLDWHDPKWPKLFSGLSCDVFIWYPHALHSQGHKLFERSFFIENFLNIRCYPGTRSAYLFQDKIRQKYVFDHYGIPTPQTQILRTNKDVIDFLEKTSYPFLVKDVWGYGGYGIEMIRSKKQGEEFLRKKRIPKKEKNTKKEKFVYVQEVIDVVEEYRIITLGDKVLLSYGKKSDKFLKHVWRGAQISFDIDRKIIQKVKNWNKKLKLDWCGWDLIKDKDGSVYLLEINPIFGTKVLESQGVNLADHLLDYVLLPQNKK